jgi:agarase
MLGTGRLSRAAALLVSSAFVMAASAAPSERLVEGFEGRTGPIRTSNASAEIVVAAGATQGRKGLRLRFEPRDEDMVTVSLSIPAEVNAMGETNLALDVTNASGVSIHLFVTLITDDGTRQRASGVIGAGKTETLYTVLTGYEAKVETGLREIPPSWKTPDQKLIGGHSGGPLEPSKIRQIEFSTQANPVAREIVVDNIRVRANPPADAFFLADIVDRFGQAAKKQYPVKISSEAELRAKAKQEMAVLAASKGAPGRSRWGGWADGPKRKGTGFFRAEKVDGKWWMIDPDGHLFFSNGLANIRMANMGTITGYDFNDPEVRFIDPEELTPDDSVDIVPVDKKYRASRFLASPLRRQMFEWLPTYDDPLGSHYGYARETKRGAVQHGEIFSFYKANLERRYGKDYMATWRKVTIDRMRDWGMTSFGNWVDPSFYQNGRIPYFANGWIIGNFKTLSSGDDVWSPLPDVYDANFVRRARLTIEQIAREVQNSPWCVGVFVDNEKSWGRGDTTAARYGVVLDALSKKISESPAKARFTQMLCDQYKTVAALNAVWGTKFASWEEFGAGAVPVQLEAARPDLSRLMRDYGERYFSTVQSELKRVMPNHMYMGVRMAQWGMPEEIIEASLKHSDVLSFNNYKEVMHPDKWDFLNAYDKPVIIGEFHIGATSDTPFYHPGLIAASDQKDRARIYEQYINSVIDHPMMVGAHWFQYIDDDVTGRSYDGENYNVGWVTTTDIPYPEMAESARRVNYGLYQRRFEKK